MPSAANQIALTITARLETGMIIWVRSMESQLYVVRILLVPVTNSKTFLLMGEIINYLLSAQLSTIINVVFNQEAAQAPIWVSKPD